MQVNHGEHPDVDIPRAPQPRGFQQRGIALLLYSVQRHQPMSARQRIMMYRFIEWVGRWSMLDIFVIAILVALVLRRYGS